MEILLELSRAPLEFEIRIIEKKKIHRELYYTEVEPFF